MKTLTAELYLKELKSGKDASKPDVTDAVRSIIESVREKGDAAVFAYERQFDQAELTSLVVTKEEIDEAIAKVPKQFFRVLKKAAKNIRAFHEKQKRKGFVLTGKGKRIGQKVLPIERAALYVPGGTAAYPSTVLMNAIPAKIAGCAEVCIATPPLINGRINPVILAAAHIAGVDTIYKMGGAQAIAALAYGTESVKKADKIVGPGNVYVAEAKRQVYGQVSIDMIAGPSEIAVLADEKSNPRFVAADLLSQAEHDKNARAILITPSESLAKEVEKAIEAELDRLKRKEIASVSIEKNGRIVLVKDMEEGVAVANEIAPEHLEICSDEPDRYLDLVKNAGSVFLGRYCPEALGDYLGGPNHTLPTSGAARFSSPLSVDDFIKKTQFIYYDEDAFLKVAEDVAYFATKEGLTAHAESALVRLEKK